MNVLVNGCFDPFHYGHLLHFVEAKQFGILKFGHGSKLVVGLTSDVAMDRERGSRRRLFTEFQRADVLRHIPLVDYVCRVDGVSDALALIGRGDIFVKGPDYVGKIDASVQDYCHREGIEIRFTTSPKWSATEVANELRCR